MRLSAKDVSILYKVDSEVNICLQLNLKELVDKLYNKLIFDDKNKGITLYGDVGSGKSTIALGLANQLIEGWTIFYLEGIDSSLSPYLTWHIGTRLYSKQKAP